MHNYQYPSYDRQTVAQIRDELASWMEETLRKDGELWQRQVCQHIRETYPEYRSQLFEKRGYNRINRTALKKFKARFEEGEMRLRRDPVVWLMRWHSLENTWGPRILNGT